jgi:hypothetical protein
MKIFKATEDGLEELKGQGMIGTAIEITQDKNGNFVKLDKYSNRKEKRTQISKIRKGE